jgi:hypothetical protein
MSDLSEGMKFDDVSADEFGRINRAANSRGLQALVTELLSTEDGKRVSFELIKQKLN